LYKLVSSFFVRFGRFVFKFLFCFSMPIQPAAGVLTQAFAAKPGCLKTWVKTHATLLEHA
jgi:hypothetical protein